MKEQKLCRVILLVLLTVSNAAWAEWKQVVAGANSTGYFDTDSIRGSGPSTIMQVLIDYKKPPFDGNNLPYLSLTMRVEYRCDDARFRVLAIASHTGHMGQGERPYATTDVADWESVSPRTIQQGLWKIACSKAASLPY